MNATYNYTLWRHIFVFLMCILTTTVSAQNQSKPILSSDAQEVMPYSKFKRQKDDPAARLAHEKLMTENPITHEIPRNITELEHIFGDALKAKNANKRIIQPIHSPWQQRGPYNVGGRTRALALDRNNEKIIFAGGVAGGLWRSINEGESWVKVTSSTDRQGITCIVQDPRSAYSNIWYYGAGEVYGNSASGGGATYRGNGIFKSYDNGVTWAPIEETESDPTESEGHFQFVNKLAMDLEGNLYAAHAEGISISRDGGVSWELVLGEDRNSFSEVIVGPNNEVYATIANYGIFSSNDMGKSWINITPDPLKNFGFQRVVIDISPSNPNKVMFFVHFPNKGVSNHMLFEYTADNNYWRNLTSNLPQFGGYVGNMSQGSYNQFIKYKPDDENVVFLGSTNVYRSNNAFRTTTETKWIGGYSTVNNVSLYKNHHPDNHDLVFLPSNSNHVISAHDGGLSKTSNIMADVVDWEFINNGYYTTQSYAIAIAEKNYFDTQLLAGFQDNGKWYSKSSDITSDWIEEYGGGDGCFVHIVSDEPMRYTSTQYGKILRFKGEDPRNPTDYDGIHPRDASGQMFVNPFLIDHVDENIMYYPSGRTLWVNTELDNINSGYTFNGTRTGWAKYANVAASGTITALDVSTEGNHRLYYGTSAGMVYRIDNPTNASATVNTISTDKGLPTGFISCIAVNPIDDEHVVIVLSNYQTQSIFESKDAGNTWAHITGNLEENEDGSGAGPSVRWFAFHQPDGQETSYFAGTSIGLFHATSLSENTQWSQQAQNEIGDAVVGMIKTREDGFVAIGTHSNGLFTSYYGTTNTPPIVLNQIDDLIMYAGDQKIAFLVSDLFEDSEADILSYTFSVGDSSIVKASFDDEYLYIQPDQNSFGQTTVSLTASDGSLSTTMDINVTVKLISPLLYAQSENSGRTYRSQFFTDFGVPIYLADDFYVDENINWNITGVKVYHSNSSREEIYRIIIWEDDNGKPSLNQIYNSGDVPIQYMDRTYLTYNFPETLELEEGRYWLTVAPVMSYRNGGSYYWRGTGNGSQNGKEFHLLDSGDLFRNGFTEWTPRSELNYRDYDLAFEVFGRSEGGNPPSQVENLTAKVDGHTNVLLTWQSNQEVSGYTIERSISPDGSYIAIGNVEKDNLSFVDQAKKTQGVTYYYKVRAFTSNGIATQSPIATARITSIPNPVHLLKVEKEQNGFYLQWEDQSNDEEFFTIEYSLNEYHGYVPIAEVSRNTSNYLLDNIPFGSLKYYFRVAAVNGAGMSTYTYTSTYSLLEQPTNIHIDQLSVNSLQIQWKDNSALETGFLLEYSVDGGVNFAHAITTDVNQSMITLEQLIPNATYYFKLSAINGLLDGTLKSTPQLFLYTLSDDSAPKAPSSLNGVANGTSSVQLTWEDDISNELGFYVYRKDALSEEFEKIADLTYNHQEFLDVNIDEGMTYEYKVASYNHLGEQLSDIAQAQLGIHAPDNFELLHSDNKIYLKWDDLSNLESSYCIFRRSGNGSFVRIESLPSSTSQFVDENVYANINYEYYVAATYSGEYYPSSIKAVNTHPQSPKGLTSLEVTEYTHGVVTVEWEDLNEDGDEYKVYRKLVGSEDSVHIVSVETSTKEIFDNTILSGEKYYYYVTEFNEGVAGITQSAYIKTEENISLPIIAENFRVVKENDGLMLMWEDRSDNEHGYQIYRAERNSGTVNQLVELPANTTKYYDNSVADGEEYKYLLIAFNSMGYSPEVECMYLMFDQTENDIIPPNTVKVLDILDHHKVTWKDVSSNEHGFRIYRSRVNSTDTLMIGQVDMNEQIFKDYSVLEEGDYHYWIKAFNSSGESVDSEHFLYSKTTDVNNLLSSLNQPIRLYPNPSTGQFTVELENNWHQKVSIAVFTVDGQKVYHQEFENRLITLNLEHLFTGQYILKVFDEEKSEHQMIVKE
ncbi:fibronectin type III domain-containing protein [Flammeovirga yaeyamensis]|uniref:Fibronectin type III domain-containing protein n=1 Tax=Flammeovirga yaeyamensis TaxID=367791 RepID=A0AAX1N5G7_9BACT|nr:fibronectin type III domain-containing protein [Flammeovirga yaeyamensis]MBB3697316.1 hypothetical protein [Flammeovirga yaeyamensis]NMF36010.1 T9SS type A sorting domain-containing protein [Flammeovirga yaeyamensis]QWG02746.1 fibronectin type III domain-containing protein [Flammeovirga yaeyamensis]